MNDLCFFSLLHCQKNDEAIKAEQFCHVIHFVDNLRTKILIEMNIFGSERVVFDINKQKIYLNCFS